MSSNFATRIASAAFSVAMSAVFFAYAIIPASPDVALAAGGFA